MLSKLDNRADLRFLGRTSANEIYKLWQDEVEKLFTKSVTSYKLSMTENGIKSEPFNALTKNIEFRTDTLYHLRIECNQLVKIENKTRITHYQVIAINGKVLEMPIKFKTLRVPVKSKVQRPKLINKRKTEYDRKTDQKIINALYKHDGLKKNQLIEICKKINPKSLFNNITSHNYTYLESITSKRNITRHTHACSVIQTEEKNYMIVTNESLTAVLDVLCDPMEAYHQARKGNFKPGNIPNRFMRGIYIEVAEQACGFVNLYDLFDFPEKVLLTANDINENKAELMEVLSKQRNFDDYAELTWSTLKHYHKKPVVMFIEIEDLPHHYTVFFPPTR